MRAGRDACYLQRHRAATGALAVHRRLERVRARRGAARRRARRVLRRARRRRLGGRGGESEGPARPAVPIRSSPACPAYDTNAAAFFASLAGRVPARLCGGVPACRNDATLRADACAMREDRGRFAALRNARVLIYWPHGLGDWVTFGAVVAAARAVEYATRSRASATTTSASWKDAAGIVPLFERRARAERRRGSRRASPRARAAANATGGSVGTCNCRRRSTMRSAASRPTSLLWTDYPETEGRTAYPVSHQGAKPRAAARAAGAARDVRSRRAAAGNAIDFAAAGRRATAGGRAPGAVRAARNARGRDLAQRRDRRRERTGATVRRRARSSRRCGGSAAVALHLHGRRGSRRRRRGVPRALRRARRAVCAVSTRRWRARIDLFVGIPAGPLHLTMARGGVPTVGLWLAHHPDWYDEPNPDAMHLVGRYVRERGFDRRPATTTKPPSLQHRFVISKRRRSARTTWSKRPQRSS